MENADGDFPPPPEGRVVSNHASPDEAPPIMQNPPPQLAMENTEPRGPSVLLTPSPTTATEDEGKVSSAPGVPGAGVHEELAKDSVPDESLSLKPKHAVSSGEDPTAPPPPPRRQHPDPGAGDGDAQGEVDDDPQAPPPPPTRNISDSDGPPVGGTVPVPPPPPPRKNSTADDTVGSASQSSKSGATIRFRFL